MTRPHINSSTLNLRVKLARARSLVLRLVAEGTSPTDETTGLIDEIENELAQRNLD